MKKLISLLTLVMLVSGCGTNSNGVKSGEMSKEELDQATERMVEMLVKPDEEQVSLLSLKYSIDETKTSGILTEYALKSKSSYKRALKGLITDDAEKAKYSLSNDKELTIKELIDNLSSKYGVPVDKIASLINDYQLWKKVDSMEEF